MPNLRCEIERELSMVAQRAGLGETSERPTATDLALHTLATAESSNADVRVLGIGSKQSEENDGGETIPLEEKEVRYRKERVTAEDGRTVKNYFIRVTRLSPSDTSPSGLELSAASNLSP
ncbi:hypothetical protein P5673_028448 [Acropora cervicornis]|uniref:Uncharacterized protein n=1 Tax=Acropora cervicornis TaxID=6130 RepID=A0AAD9UUT5_ACRCE|nr:hypothetical protein P5673_028448 [Acropora cervicornis]